MDPNRHHRVPLKARQPKWREQLRQNCLMRVQNDREKLLWKIRSQGDKPFLEEDKMGSTVRNIVSEELQKMKVSPSNAKENDQIWEYEDQFGNVTESEEVLLEMERLLYKELREELMRRELEFLEEEDAYMEQQAFEHMQSNENQGLQNKLWCPVCKKGELKDMHNLIYCTCCNMRLDIGDDKINLEFLRDRLAEVHNVHFDRGCKSTPKFCVETNFGLTALYIKCEACSVYEVVF
ncbi:RPA-interacting protein [Rhynchospora pubera]|uniref:RPA-interacting protein n=1 Tax=Rhynchospora pubera TaxID=906938 RepID=A0AAV8BYJ4_9POAL|nr:RPA-interacting protein [Rhynchospora pubera]